MWTEDNTVRAVTAYVSLITGVVLVFLFAYMVVTGHTDADIMIKVLTAIVAGGNIGKGLVPAAMDRLKPKD